MKLHEIRILSSIHPTDNQKRVIATIIAAPTPKLAGEEISGSENLTAARNMLMKLNVITFSNGEAKLTDIGNQLAQEENIADENGELTDTGKELVYGNNQQQPPEQPAPEETLGLESFSLLRTLLKG